MRKFNADAMAAPTVPLSHGVVAGDWLYVSGMVARTPDGDIISDDARSSTRQCLENLQHVLDTAGADRDRVVKVNVYLNDFGDYRAMNEAFTDFFGGEFPARTTTGADLGLGRVELDAVAYLGTA